MKLVLLLLAVFVLLWMLRGSVRRNLPRRAEPPPSTPPQQMVTCALCGLHLPRDESLPGRGGVFCGEAHRAAFEKEHPGS
jgi:uncharacterized protein